MKKIIYTILSLLWLAGVIIYAYSEISEQSSGLEYTAYNDATYRDDDLYVTENTGESGHVLHLDSNNNVKSVLRMDSIASETWAEQVVYSQNKVYLLVTAETVKNSRKVEVFNVFRLDPDTLEPDACQHWMQPYAEGPISDITVDGDYVYVTQLIEQKQKACVYAISMNSFLKLDEVEDLNTRRNVRTVRYSDYTEATDGYSFVYARFDQGEMVTLENGKGLILGDCYDSAAAERYEAKTFTIRQLILMNQDLIIQCALIWLAGQLILTAIFIFFHRRNRVGYMIFIWEVMLIIIFVTGAYFVRTITRTQDLNQGVRFATYAMRTLRSELSDVEERYQDTDEFYDSEDYRDLVQKLNELDFSYDNGDTFVNILMMNTKTDQVIASARNYDRCSFEKLYGTTADLVAVLASITGEPQPYHTTIDGRELYFVFLGDVDAPQPDVILVGVFDVNEIYQMFFAENLLHILLVVLWVIASVAGIIILLLQSYDLHRIGDSMEAVAGEHDIEKPKYLGADVGDMWSGLLDINRSIKNVNYTKYKIYEAYYRFAPKSVATLLGKDSITEVSNGDSISSMGTVAAFRMDIHRVLTLATGAEVVAAEISDGNIRHIMELINDYQEKGQVLQVSSDADMSDMKFIMPENNRQPIDFGIEFHKTLQKGGLLDASKTVTIFMHYSDFTYGVAGTEEHAVQVMIAPGFIALEDYLDVLTDLCLRLVVTKPVFDRESEQPAHRRIGYFQTGEQEPVELIEILEACPDEERKAKQETNETFQKALQMFLEYDFYLARNNFAHILKVNPQDTVARWYVFACEKYLEEGISKMQIGINQDLDF